MTTLIDELKCYSLDEEIINQSLKLRLEKKQYISLKKEKCIISTKNKIFIPMEKDKLFWCFFAIKNGEINYEMLEHKNVVTEKKIKIEYVEKMRKEKQLVKTYKFSSFVNIENNLANDSIIDIKTFLTLCVIDNFNIIFVKRRTYYELTMNDSNELYIVYLLDNGKYGFEKNENNIAEIHRSTLFKIENIDKPVKSFSAYKVGELIDLCNKLEIATVNDTNKVKNKKDLYELIIQYF
jgi:hypothetical protein